MTADTIAVWSLWIALLSLVGSAVALVVAFFGIWRSNRNSSAATLVTMYDGFSEAWRRLHDARNDPARVAHELAELMNLIEMACAIYDERSLVGRSRELIEEYLDQALTLMANNAAVRALLPQMFTSPTTFKYIRKFAKSRPHYLPMLEASTRCPTTITGAAKGHDAAKAD